MRTERDPSAPPRASAYPTYVLCVLIVVYILNFIDRQILAVLAESIKADLGISDADLGFLFGTAFAVFYAVMGIPLARLADTSSRKNLIASGLALWSVMTALSGLARGFLPLAICRFGVGIGEASASPAAYSLLYDYFEPKVRTTILALYSSGVFIGQGIGIFLGGAVLSAWTSAYPDPISAPLGLRGWQAAFLIVGAPGMLAALWVATLREPVRGRFDGAHAEEKQSKPLLGALTLLASMIPPFSLWLLWPAGLGAVSLNLITGAAIVAAAYELTALTGDVEQWAALSFGLYAVFCWTQVLAWRDRACFALIFKGRALMCTVFGGAAASFMLSALGFWSIPFYQRHFGLNAGEAGLLVGGATTIMGFIGVTLGGVIADRLRARLRSGKLIVLLCALIGSTICAALMLASPTVPVAFIGTLGLTLFSSAGLGPGISTFNDLVLPRMRATSSAFGFMVTFLIAGALGPYAIGKISDVLNVSLGDPGEALRRAMAMSLAIPMIGLLLILFAIGAIDRDETNLLQRARAAGERL